MSLTGLEACSSALTACNATIHASVLSLGEGTSDYSRLISILQVTQAYELVSVDEIEQAKRDVEAHVEPQIQQLIQRAEQGLEALQRKERKCNEQAEQRKQRQLNSQTIQQQQQQQQVLPPVTTATSMEVAKARARLMALQTQKETLLKAADRVSEDIRSKKVLLEAD